MPEPLLQIVYQMGVFQVWGYPTTIGETTSEIPNNLDVATRFFLLASYGQKIPTFIARSPLKSCHVCKIDTAFFSKFSKLQQLVHIPVEKM
jgi:hypothetical protein